MSEVFQDNAGSLWSGRRNLSPTGIRSGVFAVLVASAGLGPIGCSVQGVDESGVGRSVQQAVEEEVCLVGEHTIEHSCPHVTYGPFASVSASPYPGAVFSTINTPHTAYTVNLPSAGVEFGGQVIYQPSTTGAFAFFLSPDVELTLYPGSGPALIPIGEQAVTADECSGLSTAVVYALDENETYTVVYGPTAAGSVLTIAEYLGSEPSCEECEHIDLEASLSRHPRTREDGVVHLEHEVAFEVPEEIAVVSGSGVGALAVFKFGHGLSLSKCLYLGGFGANGALSLLGCTHGYEAGSDAEADTFELSVKTTGLGNSVGLELEIQPETCGAHEDE
jgi:hypothetical protein